MLEELDTKVQLYYQALEDLENQEGATRLFDIWKRMLEVKYEYEIQQQDSIHYKGFDVDGSRLFLNVKRRLRRNTGPTTHSASS